MTEAWETDVAIVGAGLAGLTAGARLAQQGIRVILVERGSDDDYLCNSRVASGSLHLAGADPTRAPRALLESIAAQVGGAIGPDLALAVAEAIGPALAYLRTQRVRVGRVARPGRGVGSLSLWPPRPAQPGFDWRGRGPDLALRALLARVRESGGTVAFGARALELILSSGEIAGVRGTLGPAPFELRARCVVLADGGFQGDRDLVARFVSTRPGALVARHAGTSTGDGLKMAEAIGAEIVGASWFYGHLLAQEALRDARLWPYPTLDSLVEASILVDRDGRRFVDEAKGGVALANALAKLSDPLAAAVVFDNVVWETVGRSDFTPPNPYVISGGGKLESAGSIAALARLIDVPADRLVATVEAYNASIATGRPDALSPPRAIVAAPFHAIRVCAGLTYTMGGARIDAQARVLYANGSPIAGLYAAGSCAGGLEGGPDVGYLGGLCKAISLGYIAGGSAGVRLSL